MADINDLQQSEVVRVTDGEEVNTLSIFNSGHAYVSDSITFALQATINLTTTTVIAKVGASNLANRKRIFIYNTSGSRSVYYSFNTPANSNNSFILPTNGVLTLDLSDNVNLYIASQQGNFNVVIAEVS